MKMIAEKGSIHDIDEIPEDVRQVFRISHDINSVWHVRMQAAFQKYTDNAVSKTVNFPQDATEEDIRDAYMLAYRSGCKGITIYRDKSREEQVLNIESGKAPSKRSEKSTIAPRPRPNVTTGTTTKVTTGCGNLYITINEDEQHLPFEVFMQMGKAGGCAMSQLEAIGRLLSLALRSGIETHAIIEQLRGIRCPNPSWEKGGRIFSCSDAIARVVEQRLIKAKQESDKKAVQETIDPPAQSFTASQDSTSTAVKKKLGNIVGVCPDCGAALYQVEGCNMCHSCGYSKCG
jgi:ribonucleoside-diphosphate reductase alpha chain